MSDNEKPSVPHIVILQHGLPGSTRDFSNYDRKVRKMCCTFNMLSHNCTFNKDLLGIVCNSTKDGIDVCGKRLAEEIESLVERYQLPPGTKLTMVGHSMGGLFIRYAIGYMLQRETLQHFELESLITFSVPHHGELRKSRVSRFLVGTFCNIMTGKSGKQLDLKDNDGENGEPLLLTMSNPNSPYFAALKSFKTRAAYGNVTGDYPVPFRLATLLPSNPFKRKDLNLVYMQKYPHVLDNAATLHLNPDFELHAVPTPSVAEVSTEDSAKANSRSIKRREEITNAILANLLQLQWERHAVHFSSLLAHDQIIAMTKLLPGSDVIKHSIENYVMKPHIEDLLSGQSISSSSI